ncbi:ABC transporter ATP-binding protein [Flavonifractor sp. An306]|uniref:ABC transporter ATP-binding protein n=1 Tax=Flavonifractor sp. An306 TaxID=1965629 RepID=UPI00174C9E21|nr:ABC transporter ATP-binding protein [Flavonifractor sp. An306]
MKKASVSELLKLLLPYKFGISGIILILILNAIFSLILPLLSKSIMDDGFIGGDQGVLILRVMQTLILVILICGIDIVKDKIRIGIQNDLKLNLSSNSFQHLSRLNMSYFDEKNDAEILNNLRMDIENICMVADNSLFFVFAQVFSIIGGMVGLFILNAKLAGLVILLIPIKYLIARYFAKKNKKIMQQYIESEEVYSKWFGDVVSGMREIKLFNLYQHKYVELQGYQERIVKSSKKANLLLTYNTTVEKITMQLLMSCIYILGAIQVFNLETSVGTTFAFISYSAYVTSPITAIMNIKQMLAGIFPSVERYVAFVNIEEEQVEGEKVPSMGDIILTDVSMYYDTNPNKYAIENLSLTIKAGSKTAVIGTNGSGKSTLINLLLRLYRYNSGNITMNGVEISSLNLDDYRSMFSVVSQDVVLFNGTIKDNLCLYKDFSDSAIKFAIQASGLEGFIKEHSLDYVVGERGTALSGGEKQKLSLARAILHDKPILILDEATANTDVYSKKYIHNYLFEATEKTVIIITHSDEVLQMMDNIVFLENGKVLCHGTYQELLSQNKDFQNMMTALNH